MNKYHFTNFIRYAGEHISQASIEADNELIPLNSITFDSKKKRLCFENGSGEYDYIPLKNIKCFD